jgi:hypothetical protein
VLNLGVFGKGLGKEIINSVFIRLNIYLGTLDINLSHIRHVIEGILSLCYYFRLGLKFKIKFPNSIVQTCIVVDGNCHYHLLSRGNRK